jgi:hypothetical protein
MTFCRHRHHGSSIFNSKHLHSNIGKHITARPMCYRDTRVRHTDLYNRLFSLVVGNMYLKKNINKN